MQSQAHNGPAIWVALASFLVSGAAFGATALGLVRRPRITAVWGAVQGGDVQPPFEGLSVIVTARRRPIEIDEIGIVLLPERPPRRMQMPEWIHSSEPFRVSLNPTRGVGLVRPEMPASLNDGQSIRGFIDIESAIEEIPSGGATTTYVYVLASGTVYLKRDRKLRERLAAKRRAIGAENHRCPGCGGWQSPMSTFVPPALGPASPVVATDCASCGRHLELSPDGQRWVMSATGG